jgi:hypothetical protein
MFMSLWRVEKCRERRIELLEPEKPFQKEQSGDSVVVVVVVVVVTVRPTADCRKSDSFKLRRVFEGYARVGRETRR